MSFLLFSLPLSCSGESQEKIDAELSARVLQLVNVTDSGLHCQVCLFLKLVILYEVCYCCCLFIIFSKNLLFCLNILTYILQSYVCST